MPQGKSLEASQYDYKAKWLIKYGENNDGTEIEQREIA